VSDQPTRLALQTGRLDDHPRHIEPGDELWDRAHAWFCARDSSDGAPDAEHTRELCEIWPRRDAEPARDAEAVAVTLALTAPFAGPDRVLAALRAAGVATAPAADGDRPAPFSVSPWNVWRPHFPHIYDPDSEHRAPVIAVLDGPRSPRVAELLNAIREQDERLADAVVLGADLETLESLDRLALDAGRAGRDELAAQVEHDRQHWRHRADQARARQRLEGSQYGWLSDNFPPGCLEAARAERRHDVDVLLEHPPPPRG